MATVTRRSDYSLESQLYQEAYEFEFSQAIRILEALNSHKENLGEGDDPLKEALQIKSRMTLSVSSSDLYKVNSGLPRPALTVNFLGLAGIQGPLPTSYTEMIMDRIRQKDYAGRDFLDIFNHRLVSFWYRIRKKVVLGLDMIPPETTTAGKSFLDLIGLSSPWLQGKLAVPDRSLLGFTPLFWQRVRSTAGLQQLLKNYFKINIRIEEIHGQWRHALPEDLSRIGLSKGQHNQLGKSLLIGRRSWDQAASIKIYLDQIGWEKYLTHLPGQPGHTALGSLTRFYVGHSITCHFYASLKKEEIAPCTLGHQNRLGQTTWLTRGQGQGFKQSPVIRLSYGNL